MNQYKPMLAGSAQTPFSSNDWIFEVKWDGIRAIAYVNDELLLKSRNQKDLNSLFPELKELTKLTSNVVIDGEIIVMNKGKVDFQKVLKRIQAGSPREVSVLEKKFPVLYIVFDILEKDGKSLINKQLIERKKILQDTLKEGRNVILSVFVEKHGEAYFEESLKKGLEGIMAKKKDSKYTPGKRGKAWLKIKKTQECDCVIFGYTQGTGSRKDTFGALILGLYEGKNAIFVGKVGTGFNQTTLEELTEKFQGLKTDEKILKSIDIPDEITWLKPVLVCRIGYQSVTAEEKLRIPRFLGLREDKDPLDCKLEQIKTKRLGEYLQKRDFKISPEPVGSKNEKGVDKIFVVQEHDASHLHYDLRLEHDGVLKSWAVPKGVPQKQGLKRLAVHTEDHPMEYAKFQGIIPKGQYGGGTVKIWDKGKLSVKEWGKDKIEFSLQGTKLDGNFVLIHFKKGSDKNWLLIKVSEYK